MTYYLVGLGNPGEEYENTRHNTGRSLVETFHKRHNVDDWIEKQKTKALVSNGSLGKEKITLILPETFMNKSGLAVKEHITSAKKAEQLVVVYDDLDLPLGTVKISFGRGSGGHKGVESIIRSIKTKDFIRLRIGISPSTHSGKLKKPRGDNKVHDFIIGQFSKKEKEALKKTFKKAITALEAIIKNGRKAAMNEFN